MSGQAGNQEAAAVRRRLDALWRIEGARIVAALARATRDVGFAEDLAQEALAEALVQWPESGTPANPAAWLTAVAKRKAIDDWRRSERLGERYRAMARDLEDDDGVAWVPLEDDVLRLVFTACHPVLSREAQMALTLRVVGSLTTEEIARLFLAPVATVQQVIVRAKKTLAAARVPFEVPEPNEWGARLGAVLGVVYLMFTEGYAATTGDAWIRPDLAREALRIGRILAGLVPREPEAHGLVAAIAECHSTAASVDDTDWQRIVLFYEALGRIAPSPVVELNRAVAVSMATGPAAALVIADCLAAGGALRGTHLLPSVRGELLVRLGRTNEARSEFVAAAGLARNQRTRALLEQRAAGISPGRQHLAAPPASSRAASISPAR